MLDDRFRFDTFVVGASNRLAVAAAHAVAQSPGSVYNPLFVYADAGLGKTHLLAAIGHETRTLHPELAIEYLVLDDFVEQLEGAVAAGQVEGFTRRFRQVDLLLLDDIQFVAGRAATQREVLRLLNALQVERRQIVVASDRPPGDLDDIDQRLLSRMSGGLIVDIGPAEYETRVAILRHKCRQRGIEFGTGVLEEVARTGDGNVRELEGLLNRIIAEQSLGGSPLTVEAVQRALGGGIAHAPPVDEYEAFLSEISVTVSESVEAWRMRLGESIARWSGEGFRVDMLERVLDAPDAPDLDALESRFVAATNRLRSLEMEAARLDPKLAGLPVFRDPERVDEAEGIVLRALAAYDPPPGPSRHYTIEGFATGERTRLAIRAAGEVIALPGTRYSPLFIVGPARSGKTHLAHAIGNALAARDGGAWTVACVPVDTFSGELIDALHEGTLGRWRMRYRAVDAFILDGVDQLAGKERTQDELFHLFNLLHGARKQIVLTANVAPALITDLAPRLRSRFDGGLVVEIGRVPHAERVARYTPVPDGAEAAAPTIDARFEEYAHAERDQGLPAAVLATDERVDTFFLDPEKVIAEWPTLEGRILEEPR